MKKRTVFFISDGTGITAEALGHSLLTQFEHIQFEEIIIPYVDTREKAERAVKQINEINQNNGCRPLIFSTLASLEIYQTMASSQGLLLDFFKTFIDPLEIELGTKSSHSIGKAHALDDGTYTTRIEAMNFALSNDDGANIHNYNRADVILLGVSRCAKTPTCLYLALQFGIFAANYPFTEEDIDDLHLPAFLHDFRHKLFGLTIDPHRLHAIRHERQPNSRYASLKQCENEVRAIELLYRRHKIPFTSTTSRSIEEISSTIINTKNLKRRLLKGGK